jgi:murein DD-endopeptidase MepM/ murein hydrolase activator NlpD
VTGSQPTIWSSPAGSSDEASVDPDPESASPAVAVETPVEDVPNPVHAAPMTRASRRVRTASVSTTPMPAESLEPADPQHPAGALVDEPVEMVPAAAIAWAAAAAAAAATVEPQPVVVVEPVLAPAEPFELLEPAAVEMPTAASVDPPAEATSTEQPRAEASDSDEFLAAARLFSFTSETPVVRDDPAQSQADVDDELLDDSEPVLVPDVESPRRRARNYGRQLTAASFSFGVMGIDGLLTVGMTTPAVAVAAVAGTESTSFVVAQGTDAEVDPDDIQAYVAPESIESAAVDRDENYSTVSMGEIAAEDGITNYSNFFVNDPNAAIQWPFAVGVPITFGFGMRSGRMHEGADFVPGQGAEVQAIADGTVRVATNSGGAYGVTVVIDHIIDGELVSSRYAHMLYGSLKVSEGQQVTVGTILGNTGNTGRSYGAHTHFEILQGGTTAIDPIEWMRSHAGRASLDSQ